MNSSVAAGTERSTIRASHPDSYAPSPANPFRYLTFALSLCLLWIMGGGCIFSPKKGGGPPPDPPIIYPERNTPRNTVKFLTVAWGARDSAQIAKVYADDYTGNSSDLTGTTPVSFSFVKSEEVRSVGAMALRQSIVQIQMEFGPMETWIESHYASDPPDWQSVRIPGFTIYVNDGGEEYRAKSPAIGEIWDFEFTMRPTYPNGPTGEPVWEIVRWVESRQPN